MTDFARGSSDWRPTPTRIRYSFLTSNGICMCEQILPLATLSALAAYRLTGEHKRIPGHAVDYLNDENDRAFVS